MLSLRSILSRQNKSFTGDKMLRRLSMTDVFYVILMPYPLGPAALTLSSP
jgi:hypothetical protein